jgi:hypothetical protein
MSDTAVPSPGSLCGQFCAEIKHIQEFLVAQQRITDITELRSAQCQGISNRIRSLRVMGLQDGTAITSLLETGPWTPQQKQDMAAVVQDRLTAGSSECISGAKTRRRQQVCLSFEHYFTDRDLDIIRDQSTSKCLCYFNDVGIFVHTNELHFTYTFLNTTLRPHVFCFSRQIIFDSHI